MPTYTIEYASGVRVKSEKKLEALTKNINRPNVNIYNSGLRVWNSNTGYTPIGLQQLENENRVSKVRGYTNDYKNDDGTYNLKGVNHPTHYNSSLNGIETIETIKSTMHTHNEYIAFLKGNVIKYLSRLGLKDSTLQDAEKAKWYMNKIVEELKGK